MRLACISVPNFRIALERARDGRLAGRALAIGDPPPGENIVVECSGEAMALGVRAGMPLRDARTIAPDLKLLPSDPAWYSQNADALLDAIETCEPHVQAAEPGTAYAALDPNAGDEALAAAAVRIIEAVREQTGVLASAGAAANHFIAWCAASVGAPGDASVVPQGNEAAFIAPLSTSFLPVSYQAHRKLGLYGLRTIGDVAALPARAVLTQFGREGQRLAELARGMDATPFVPRERKQPVRGSLTMPAPTVHTAALMAGVRQLAGRLLRHPAVRDRQVRQLRLRLALLEGGSWERTLTFREPLGDEESMLFVLKKLIEPLQLPAPVEEMTLELMGLTSETGKQRSLLFAEQTRRRAQLFAALGQLKTQFGGRSQVARVVEVEPWSRIPERRYALIDYDL